MVIEDVIDRGRESGCEAERGLGCIRGDPGGGVIFCGEIDPSEGITLDDGDIVGASLEATLAKLPALLWGLIAWNGGFGALR